MRVELVLPVTDAGPAVESSGLGRYAVTLVRHLGSMADCRIVRPRTPPLASYLTFLRHLPVGLEGHQPGAAVHFPRITGSAMMLWRPVHPAVATVHDMGHLDWPAERRMLDPVARAILRISFAGLRRMDLIIADSEFTRLSVIRHLDRLPANVVTVYPGVDHDRFRPVPGARERLRARYPAIAAAGPGPFLLYVGSELPRKNVPGLLAALALARQQKPGLRLLKVGGAGGARFRRDTLSALSQLDLGGSVILLDRVPEADLPLFYAAADLYVQASWLEGFCFPVVEAMACGLPVLCTDAGSLPEVTGGAGALIAAGDGQALAAGILRLTEDRAERERLAAAGRARAHSFTWDRCARETWAVYQRAGDVPQPTAPAPGARQE